MRLTTQGERSHLAVSFKRHFFTTAADAIGPRRILEAIRFLGLEKKNRFYQASSSGLCGLMQEAPPKKTSTLLAAQPLRSDQDARLLSHCELPRGLWNLSLQRRPLQPGKPAPGRDLCHQKKPLRLDQHQPGLGRLPLHGQYRRTTRLGPRQRLCALAVAHIARVATGRLCHRQWRAIQCVSVKRENCGHTRHATAQVRPGCG